MTDWPLVVAMIITYKRTDLAMRTIKALKEKLAYPNLGWHIADDGSPPEHIEALKEAIGRDVPTNNSNRKGVGVSMNLGMRECLVRADHILWLEDDWELQQPFDLRLSVALLKERQEVGMIRLGYISPGLEAALISSNGHLWWRLKKGPQFSFTGHASLRHRRFCEAYGSYKEGLTPGETELWMCERFKSADGPDIALAVDGGAYGVFSHIGGESLNATKPE